MRPRLPAVFAVAAVLLLAPLVAWNLAPARFSAHAHDRLAALPLALISVSHLLWQVGRRAGRLQLVQALMLSTGFLLWSATQLWPDAPRALLWNDVAIVLFVVDLWLAIARPATRSST
jgi:hypothetical protein